MSTRLRKGRRNQQAAIKTESSDLSPVAIKQENNNTTTSDNENTSPKNEKSKPHKNLLKNLKSDLSPKYINLSSETSSPSPSSPNSSYGNRSRYGREQKYREMSDDYLPTDIITPYQRKSSLPIKLIQRIPEVLLNEEIDENVNEKMTPQTTITCTPEISEFNLPTIDDDCVVVEDDCVIVEDDNDDQVKLDDEKEDRKMVNDDKPIELTGIKSGEIYWARLGTHPYWPCIISPYEESHMSSGKFVRINVRFFADKGRRSWVTLSSLLRYNGRDELLNRSKVLEQQNFKNRKGKQKLLKAFLIPKTKEANWNEAVEEADDLMLIPIDDRIEAFDTILDNKTEELQQIRREKNNETSKKRKLLIRKSSISSRTILIDDSNKSLPIATKRAKLDDDHTNNDDLLNYLIEIDRIVEDCIKRKKEMPIHITGDVIDVYNDIIEIDVKKEFFNELLKYFTGQPLTKVNDLILRLSTQITMKLPAGHIKDMKMYLQQISALKVNANVLEKCIQDIITGSAKIISRKSSMHSSMSDQINYDEDKNNDVESIKEMISLKYNKNYLFKDLKREDCCMLCFKPSGGETDIIIKCHGKCNNNYHTKCLNPLSNNCCDGCSQPENTNLIKCFVCHKYDDEKELYRCKYQNCGYSYHRTCLKYFPQSKFSNDDDLLCPRHVCHNCMSDDPRKYIHSTKKDIYMNCIKCPATYHMDSINCVPAGTEFLTANNIICPKHLEKSKKSRQVNVDWCLLCGQGGKLLLCDSCPIACHAECINKNVKIEDYIDKYICETCETGRLPVYYEIVWAKYSYYRWWPSFILPPPLIPEKLLKNRPADTSFCIKFFGSNNNAWINRERVFLYQEDDWDVNHTKSNNKNFLQSLYNAKASFNLLNDHFKGRQHLKMNHLKPHPYKKIKVNRFFNQQHQKEQQQLRYYDDINSCNCTTDDVDPCGQNSSCMNRMTNNECNSTICSVGDRCMNRVFERRTYPRVKVKQMSWKGFGLVTLVDLQKGDFVMEYVGEIIDMKEYKKREDKIAEDMNDNHYFLMINQNYIIDAGPKGNDARFINHSCEPNCDVQKWKVNGATCIGFFAKDDIPADTELTFNYNLDCLGNEKKICFCGATKCAGYIGAKYKEKVSPSSNNNNNNNSRNKNGKKKRKPRKRALTTTTSLTVSEPSKGRTTRTSSSASSAIAFETTVNANLSSNIPTNVLK